MDEVSEEHGSERREESSCCCGDLPVLVELPREAQAQFGLDLALIIAGLKQINSLLTSQVAAPLKTIQQIENEYTQFQTQVIYPLTAINQLKNAVLSFRNEMIAMNGLMSKQYVSAQLPATQRLEQLLMSGDPNAVKQVGGSFQQVYGVCRPKRRPRSSFVTALTFPTLRPRTR